jgi:hypothetical protein
MTITWTIIAVTESKPETAMSRIVTIGAVKPNNGACLVVIHVIINNVFDTCRTFQNTTIAENDRGKFTIYKTDITISATSKRIIGR